MSVSRNSGLSQRFAPRNVEVLLSSMARYTRFVLFSKMLLTFLAFIMIAIIIALPIISSDSEGLRIAFDASEGTAAESMPMMKNPRYQGVDDKNQPYTITADAAIQNDEQTVILNALKADMFLSDDSWLMLSANDGTLNTEIKTLLLSGDVQLYHDKGYEFHAPEAHIDLRKNLAYGNKNIKGYGPMGTISANNFRIENNGKRLLFNNNVSLEVVLR